MIGTATVCGVALRTATEDKDSSQDRRHIPTCQGRKGRCSWGKEVVAFLLLCRAFACSSSYQPPICCSLGACG
jgi:hypothetical protein